MHRRFTAALILFFSAFSAAAQVYLLSGTAGDEYCQSGACLKNGDYIAFGNSKNSSGQQDAWLVQFDSYGEKKLSKKFGGSGTETGLGCVASADGGFYVTGSTTSNGAGGKDIFVIAFRADLSIKWQRTFGGSGDEESYEAINTSDSGCMVVGYTRSFGNSSYNSYILKIDKNGNLQWSKVLYTSTTDVAYRCLEFEGYYYISNAVNTSSSFGLGDVHITKLDKNGNFIWNRAFGGSKNEQCWKLISTMDQKLAMVMASSSFSGGSYKELVLVKLDTAGKSIFSTKFFNSGKATDGFDLVQMPDSSFVITGHTLDVSPNGWKGILVNISANGQTHRSWFTNFSDEANLWQIRKGSRRGEFGLFGYAKLNGRNNYDFLFGLADSTFALSCQNWKTILGSTISSVTPGEKYANNLFAFSSGANVSNPGWSVVSDSSTVHIELNYQPNYSTVIPAQFLRCSLDSIKLDPGLQQRYAWSTGEKTRIIYAKKFQSYILKFWRNYCIGYDSTKIIKTYPEALVLADDTCSSSAIKIGVKQKSGYIYSWNDGSKGSENYFLTSGIYHLYATDTARKCISHDSINIVIGGMAHLKTDSASSVCLNDHFFRLKIQTVFELKNDGVKEKHWLLNDNLIQNSTDSILYKGSDTGLYTLKYAISSNRGCSDTLVNTFIIHPNPKARIFTPDTAFCMTRGKPVFADSGISNGLGYTSIWDWGDGTATTGSDSLLHEYDSFGNYLVRLICVNAFGCTDDDEKNIRIFAAPHAKIRLLTDSLQCFNNQLYSFTSAGNCDDPNEKLNSFWADDDNHSLNGADTFSPVFSNSGKHSIRLHSSTVKGCIDSSKLDIFIFDAPKIQNFSANPATSCIRNNSILFSADIDSKVLSTALYPGDGNLLSFNNNYKYSYTDTGFFTAKLIVGYDKGCSDTAITQTRILPSPKAEIIFNDSAQCFKNHLFQFKANEKGNQDQWLFSDGFTITGNQVQHAFSSWGNYLVLLITEDNAGCDDSAKMPLSVYPEPIADFSVDSVCEGNPSIFKDLSSVATGFIQKYQWTIDNQFYFDLQNVEHTFSSSGYYDASLIVWSNKGCSDTLVKSGTARVLPRPVADFSWSLISGDLDEDIWEATASPAGMTAWIWYDQNGNYGFQPRFIHHVSDSENYYLQLIIQDKNGCRDTIEKMHGFSFYSNAFIPSAFTPNGDLRNAVFKPEFDKNIKNYELIIYDRWGEKLFQTNDVNTGWDGNYMNAQAPDGIYVYQIRAGKNYLFTGTIQLLR